MCRLLEVGTKILVVELLVLFGLAFAVEAVVVAWAIGYMSVAIAYLN